MLAFCLSQIFRKGTIRILQVIPQFYTFSNKKVFIYMILRDLDAGELFSSTLHHIFSISY